MVPSVVSAVKSGASSPMRIAMIGLLPLDADANGQPLKLRARQAVGEPSPQVPARIPHRHADPRVGRPVVQVPATVERDQPLHERRSFLVLPGPLVILGGLEERRVRAGDQLERRSEEHTSELQSPMYL